jgi:hypothetical protein
VAGREAGAVAGFSRGCQCDVLAGIGVIRSGHYLRPSRFRSGERKGSEAEPQPYRRIQATYASARANREFSCPQAPLHLPHTHWEPSHRGQHLLLQQGDLPLPVGHSQPAAPPDLGSAVSGSRRASHRLTEADRSRPRGHRGPRQDLTILVIAAEPSCRAGRSTKPRPASPIW